MLTLCPVELRPISLQSVPSSAFIRRYADSFTDLARWFHYDPHDSRAVEQRLAELDKNAEQWPDRTAAAAAVLAQQRQWGAGDAALAAAAQLAEPNTHAVVTGQQVGLFGGPLYTQLKAVAAIRLAEELTACFPGRTFVPMFWMASGDSDFEEVRKSHLLGRSGEVVELALPTGDPGDGRIMRSRDVSAGLEALWPLVEEALPGGEHRDEVLIALKDCYSGGSLVDGFARWMLRLFRNTPLVVIDPQDAALCRSASSVITRQLGEFREAERKFTERTEDIRSAGFAPQVEPAAGDTSLFLLDDSARRSKIVAQGDGFILQPSGTPVSRADMLSIAAAQPERFVCGVLTRPIYQNHLFPLAAWIGGAAEIAYRAQVTALFEHHGERMAPAFLRSTATLLPRRQAELLDETGLGTLRLLRSAAGARGARGAQPPAA